MLQRFINKWVSTAHDLFGVDASSSAHWSYVWGIKGRWDERKKLESGEPVNKEVLNEEARGHYHEEIVREVRKLSKHLPEDAPELYVPHENFNREIGAFKRQRFTTKGENFEGSDAEWESYIASQLPSAQDEEELKELFKLDWVAEKPMTSKQIASGIGAHA